VLSYHNPARGQRHFEEMKDEVTRRRSLLEEFFEKLMPAGPLSE
jgi:hypothetical protein